ncbi:hypothetical protein VN97_g12849 [Penicillium thymicola]|uniref:Uncharacterized protein n=1 Tax=Penicillium thymicola TaxID=293382 RepID=A0AAI9T4R7_PENTH|nr:hypothetical protein VN97_g12849 [Penicillium thymicola]
MWWHWFLSFLFLASTFAQQAEDFFTFLGGTGTCNDETMNAFLIDAMALADAFNSAVTAISKTPAEKDGYVARCLLAAWLGIPMDDDLNWITKTDIQGRKREDYTEQWQRVLGMETLGIMLRLLRSACSHTIA